MHHLAVWAALAAAATGAPSLKEMGATGVATIQGHAISSDVRFLADDLLEGREPGTRGHAIAERFVAAGLAALGLEPAGDAGSFFQAVPMRASRIPPKDMRVDLRGGGGASLRLVPERDVMLFSSGHGAEISAEAPLVFAGFGVTAPEYGYDDLAGLDLHGKIAVVLWGAPGSGDPAWFPNTARAWYTRSRDKAQRLRARGAVGMLVVRTPAAEHIYPWPKLVRDERSSDRMDWLEGDRPGTWPPGMPVLGSLTGAALDRILAAAGRKTTGAELLRMAEARTLAGFELGLTARVRARARVRPVTANNVAAMLRGSDPSLAREVIVYTAHLDHLGVGEPVGKDAVYNGAVDNASGVAGLLAVARAFAAGPRPPRSVLFVAVTAEESSLAGSEYFARRPTVPRDGIVADVNLDTLPFYPSWDVVAVGAEHSTLGAHARAAAEAAGLALSPDPRPEQVLFIRSDQLSFVKEGIPAVWIRGGLQDQRGDAKAGSVAMDEYRARRYHQPSDEWSASFDFDSMARIARVAYLVGLSVANAAERPSWNDGDFFARVAAARGAPARGRRLVTETFAVPSSDPSIQICIRNRHVADATAFVGARIVLFVHGATFPSETAFDLDLPGGTWMDYAASRGYDAYFVDVRGYGCSSRPPAMSQPPDANPPIARTAEALEDVGTAVDFILARRHASKLNLVGWSWGTTLMAGYAAAHNDRVNKLVLYAPVWLIKDLPPTTVTVAYRSVTKEATRKGGLSGIPEGRQEELSPAAWFDKWWAANLASDPVGAAQTPPVLRAPSGALRDILQEHWGVGKPTYDPAGIRVPTLIINAEWDQDTPLYMAQELFQRLVSTPTKRQVVLAEGTHRIVLEMNRMQLIRQVQSFLDE